MTAGAGTPPKYNSALVEQVILEEAIELHPVHLSVAELSLRIVADPDDRREIEIATKAIRNLREVGLFSARSDGDCVEPTAAALRAFTLFTR